MKTLPICLLSAVCLTALCCNCKRAAAQESDATEITYCVPEHDFSVVVTGDTVYFNILEDEKSVSLVYWGRSNFDNHVIEIPAKVNHQGKEYAVVEIGNEAMGVQFYGDKEFCDVWSGDDNKVERIILPTSVKRVGYAAFTSRFRSSDYVVELTDSIEYLGSYAVNCMSIHDENMAIILPANIRVVECLLDDEDHEIADLKFSKLYIPEHLEYIGGLDNFGRSQPLFEKVEVHPKNKHFKAINGALYSYDLDKIYWSTVHENLYIPKTLRVDESTITFLEDGWYSHMQLPAFKTIVTEKGNPYSVAIDNALYDIENKCLIMVAGGEGTIVHVPAWCNSIRTIDGDHMPQTFIFSDDAPSTNVAPHH